MEQRNPVAAGPAYVVGNAGDSAALAPGGSTSFGFQATTAAGATLTAYPLQLQS